MAESIMDDIDTSLTGNAKIKVIGLGGGGCNAVEEMINTDLVGVQFICANTDVQVLSENTAPVKVQLGEKLTKGLGAGSNPAVGKEAAIESLNALRDAIGDADMLFITAGMGGGTGTGASPVVAQAAKEMGILTVGVVTKPFSFEMPKRMRQAVAGLDELKKYVDCLIVIPNDRLVSLAPKKTPFKAMLKIANEVLKNAVRGISDVILRPGLINLDFADVRSTMSEVGLALMGTGRASGENRARDAAQQAITSPLLEDVSLETAKSILYNITANDEITMEEITEIGFMISEAANNQDENMDIKFGVVTDDSMGDELQVTVIATGIEPKAAQEVDIEVTPSPKISPANPKVVDFAVSKRTLNNAEPVTTLRQTASFVRENLFEAQPQPRPRRLNEAWNEDFVRHSPYARKRDRIKTAHNPGEDGLTYDENDLEIPAFLRTQID